MSHLYKQLVLKQQKLKFNALEYFGFGANADSGVASLLHQFERSNASGAADEIFRLVANKEAENSVKKTVVSKFLGKYFMLTIYTISDNIHIKITINFQIFVFLSWSQKFA